MQSTDTAACVGAARCGILWSPSVSPVVVCSSVNDIEYPVEYVTLFVSSDISAYIGDDVAVVISIVVGAGIGLGFVVLRQEAALVW